MTDLALKSGRTLIEFPALALAPALAPRAAVLATAYSAIPALMIGYGWYFLFE